MSYTAQYDFTFPVHPKEYRYMAISQKNDRWCVYEIRESEAFAIMEVSDLTFAKGYCLKVTEEWSELIRLHAQWDEDRRSGVYRPTA